MRLRILKKQFVEDLVGNLVAYLVGVAFGHRFGRDKLALLIGHIIPLSDLSPYPPFADKAQL